MTASHGPVVGIDPGTTATGLAARVGSRLLGWEVVEDDLAGPWQEYADAVEVTAHSLLALCDADASGVPLVAVEDLIDPKGYEFVHPRDLIASARMVGYLLRGFPGAVLVRPARHGSGALATYPREIVSDREAAYADKARTWNTPRKPGKATVRHARSAWDVAGAAHLTLAVAAQRAARPNRIPTTPRGKR